MKSYPWYEMRISDETPSNFMGEFRSAIASKEWGRALYHVIQTTHPDMRELCYEIWLANAPMDLLEFEAESFLQRFLGEDPVLMEFVGYVYRLLRSPDTNGPLGILYSGVQTGIMPGYTFAVPALGMGSRGVIIIKAFALRLEFWMRPDHPRWCKGDPP